MVRDPQVPHLANMTVNAPFQKFNFKANSIIRGSPALFTCP